VRTPNDARRRAGLTAYDRMTMTEWTRRDELKERLRDWAWRMAVKYVKPPAPKGNPVSVVIRDDLLTAARQRVEVMDQRGVWWVS